MTQLATSTLTVDLQNYTLNLSAIRARIPEECAIMAVVKTNAYGLGAVPIAERALDNGVAMLGVATVGEGIALREADIDAPILVMAQPREEELPLAIRHKLKLTISDLETAERLGEAARKAKTVAAIHCEIDTGMGRQGFAVEEAPARINNLTKISNVDIEGVFTHFASADIKDDPFSENQIRIFRQVLRLLANDGIPYESVHAANSAAIINYPQSAFDMVRTGLLTYGVWPAEQPQTGEAPQPVMTWTTSVVLLRDMPGGASLSYGRTYRAPGPLKVAVLPIGYADGYPVALSNVGEVIIRGTRCPVRGQVTMNQILVDVTNAPKVATGDKATLIGTAGTETISIEELARKAKTIPYEIMTGIGPTVAREYSV